MSEREPSPELAAFYERMETYIWDHPENPERAIASFPGWEADPARVAIYGRFIRGYADDVINILFSECKSVVPEERWKRLLRDYYATRPGVDHNINGNGRDFPAFLEGQDDLPRWLPNFALHEYTRYLVGADPVEIPKHTEELAANPTLQVLQLAWRISPWRKAVNAEEPDAPAEPEAGEELSLIWRHPETEFARYIAAAPKTLLALKLAAEGIAPEAAAEAGGVPVEEVRAAVESCREWGLVLGPEPA